MFAHNAQQKPKTIRFFMGLLLVCAVILATAPTASALEPVYIPLDPLLPSAPDFPLEPIMPPGGLVLLPDLTISSGEPSFTSSGLFIFGGDTITLSQITIRNNGGDTTSFFTVWAFISTDATIDLSDTPLECPQIVCALATINLAAGQETTFGPYTYKIPAGMATGNYYVGYYVDYGETVTEYNENNNSESTAITLGMNMIPMPLKADLEITSGAPTPTPAVVEPGDTTSLATFTVKNTGIVNAGAFKIGYYLSTDGTISTADTYLGEAASTGLVASASASYGPATLTIPAGTAPGTYYVGILVDRLDAVDESDESNNAVSSPIVVANSGPQQLTVNIVGSGNVTSFPAGMDCTADPTTLTATCNTSFDAGDAVSLTATAIDGTDFTSTFTGWSGDCSGTLGCVITMSSSKTVTANFSSGGAMIPLPSGQQSWTYPPVTNPTKNNDPAQCKPFAVGDLASNLLNLQVGLPMIDGDADVYLGVWSEALDPNEFFLITSTGIQALSDGLAPWAEDVGASELDESIFGGAIALNSLPAGTYYLYLAVTPANAGTLTNLYLWGTYFVVP